MSYNDEYFSRWEESHLRNKFNSDIHILRLGCPAWVLNYFFFCTRAGGINYWLQQVRATQPKLKKKSPYLDWVSVQVTPVSCTILRPERSPQACSSSSRLWYDIAFHESPIGYSWLILFTPAGNWKEACIVCNTCNISQLIPSTVRLNAKHFESR